VTDSAAPLYPAERLELARKAAAEAGLDALLLSPGADLRYLTGYRAMLSERLTCLVVPAAGDPFLVVPALEKPGAQTSPLGGLGVDITGWDETEDPYAIVGARLPAGTRRIAVDNHMWAEKVLAFRAVLPQAAQTLASEVLRELRMRKSPAEIEALRRAGAAIDRVHRRIGSGSGPAAPSARSPATSPPPSSRPGTSPPTSSSSPRAPTAPARTTMSPTG
jgi:Xaa-Pro aminopeptidase